MNDKFVQVHGPFAANQDIVQYIKSNVNSSFRFITHLGIQTKVKNMCKINEKEFEIGKTGILDFNDVQVSSLCFLQDEAESTLVDCVLD